jgi:hypothetical protein
MSVQRVAERGDRGQIVEGPGHHAGVEHAPGVEHRLARERARLLKPLADLAEPLELGGRVPAGEELDHRDGGERGAHVGAFVEQHGRAFDRLRGGPDAGEPGHRQEEPRAAGIPRVERSAEEDSPPPRPTQQVRQVVTAEVALLGRKHDGPGERLGEHLAGDWVAVRVQRRARTGSGPPPGIGE